MSRWQIWRQTLALAYRLEKIKAQMRRVGAS